MSTWNAREYAQTMFGTVQDEKFRTVLNNENCCYQEIIPLAPPEAWDILWGMEIPEDIPPSWAAAILRFATIELSHTKIDRLVGIIATYPEQCFRLLNYGCNYQLKPSHVDSFVNGINSVREAELLLEISNCTLRWQLPTENKIGLSQTHVNHLLHVVAQYSPQSRQILSDGMYYALPQEQFEKLFESTLWDSFESSLLLVMGCKHELSQAQKQALYESALRFAPAAENLLKSYSKFAPEREQIAELVEVVATNAHSSAEIILYGKPEWFSQEQVDMLWWSASQDADVAARLVFGVPDYILDENFRTEIYYDSPNLVPSQAQIDALYERITNAEFLESSPTSYMLGFYNLSFVSFSPYFEPSQAQLEALERALKEIKNE